MDKTTPIMTDHDVLVTLNVKVDQLSADVRDIKDTILSRVVKIENRLDAIDLYHAGIDLPRLKRLADRYERFDNNWKFLLGLAMIFAGVIGGIITHALQSIFPPLR